MSSLEMLSALLSFLDARLPPVLPPALLCGVWQTGPGSDTSLLWPHAQVIRQNGVSSVQLVLRAALPVQRSSTVFEWVLLKLGKSEGHGDSLLLCVFPGCLCRLGCKAPSWQSDQVRHKH